MTFCRVCFYDVEEWRKNYFHPINNDMPSISLRKNADIITESIRSVIDAYLSCVYLFVRVYCNCFSLLRSRFISINFYFFLILNDDHYGNGKLRLVDVIAVNRGLNKHSQFARLITRKKNDVAFEKKYIFGSSKHF